MLPCLPYAICHMPYAICHMPVAVLKQRAPYFSCNQLKGLQCCCKADRWARVQTWGLEPSWRWLALESCQRVGLAAHAPSGPGIGGLQFLSHCQLGTAFFAGLWRTRVWWTHCRPVPTKACLLCSSSTPARSQRVCLRCVVTARSCQCTATTRTLGRMPSKTVKTAVLPALAAAALQC